MEKWQYRFSFFSGILFIFSFFSKELIKNSSVELSGILIFTPYILMIIYSIGIFLGYIKYALLNERKLLLYSTVLTAITYSLLIFTELISFINVITDTSLIVVIVKKSTAISFMSFGVVLFVTKKMYGKSTLLAGGVSFLFGFSLIVPVSTFVIVSQLPVFLILFILLTYIINKNEEKMKAKTVQPRFLKDRF